MQKSLMEVKALDVLPFRARPRCPLCDGGSRRVLYRFEGLSVARCTDCAMVWTDPYLTEEGMQKVFSRQIQSRFPHLARYDAVGMGEVPRDSHTARGFEQALQRLGKGDAYPGPLLDMGCGSGMFLRMAKARGWDARGVDFDSKHVASLKRQGIPVQVGGWRQKETAPGTYGAISLWDVFEHLESPREVLKECRRLLKPNGQLLIACPNHRSLATWVGYLLYWLSLGTMRGPLNYLYVITHPLYFQPRVLRRLLRDEGFVPEDSQVDHTDLDRLDVPMTTRMGAKALFALAKPLHAGNRLRVIARKA